MYLSLPTGIALPCTSQPVSVTNLLGSLTLQYYLVPHNYSAGSDGTRTAKDVVSCSKKSTQNLCH
jgi:hypothetical protein